MHKISRKVNISNQSPQFMLASGAEVPLRCQNGGKSNFYVFDVLFKFTHSDVQIINPSAVVVKSHMVKNCARMKQAESSFY